MVIIRDEKRIQRLSRISKGVSLFGIVALIGGLVLALTTGAEGDSPVGQLLGGSPETIVRVQLGALGIGWICSQIGMYLAHRYVKTPRPDEVIDSALGRVARNGRLYHYVLPAPHVLLTASGIIILVAKYQTGQISVEEQTIKQSRMGIGRFVGFGNSDEDETPEVKVDKWKQSGLGMRRFFGQENLGNPSREAENQLRMMADFIRKNAPEVDEVPMATLIVFTHNEPKQLDLQNTRTPAMHHAKVKSYLRRKRKNQPMPSETYEALQKAFDAKASHFLELAYEPETV